MTAAWLSAPALAPPTAAGPAPPDQDSLKFRLGKWLILRPFNEDRLAHRGGLRDIAPATGHRSPTVRGSEFFLREDTYCFIPMIHPVSWE
jgi:hypothetical protein